MITPKARKYLQEKSPKDLEMIDALITCGENLKMVIDRIGKVAGQSGNKDEFTAYTKPWLTTFVDDKDQSGSIASFIESIVGTHLDYDDEPYED